MVMVMAVVMMMVTTTTTMMMIINYAHEFQLALSMSVYLTDDLW